MNNLNVRPPRPAHQYIGARYVPIFDGDWDNSKSYDPLIIVSHNGNSYTSRSYVPVGIAITNTRYWALTGNYNAQVEAYRQETERVANKVDNRGVTVKDYGAVGDGVHDDTQAIMNCLNDNEDRNVIFPDGTYLVSDTIVIDANKFNTVMFDGCIIKSNVGGITIVDLGGDEPVETGHLPNVITGQLTVDCNYKASVVGVNVNRGLWNGYIESIKITNLGPDAIGVVIGGTGDAPTSWSTTIERIEVQSAGSDKNNLGIKVNTYDSYINSVKTYGCTIGIEQMASANTINYAHIWATFWIPYTKTQYEATRGVVDHGSNKYGELYCDNTYVGLDAEKGALVDTYVFTIPEFENSVELTDVYAVKCYNYYRVLISKMTSSCYTSGITVHDLYQANQTKLATPCQKKLWKADFNFFNVKGKHSILSELYNSCNGYVPNQLCSYGTFDETKYYLLGYVKMLGGSIRFNVSAQYRHVVNVEMRCGDNAINDIFAYSDGEVPFTLVRGGGVLYQNCYYTPIYIGCSTEQSFSCEVISSIGEIGLYHDYVDTPASLQTIEREGSTVYSIPINTKGRIVEAVYNYSGTINGNTTISVDKPANVTMTMIPLGFISVNPIIGSFRNYYIDRSDYSFDGTILTSDSYTATDITVARATFYKPPIV